VVEVLRARGEVPAAELTALADCGYGVLRAMADAGSITLRRQPPPPPPTLPAVPAEGDSDVAPLPGGLPGGVILARIGGAEPVPASLFAYARALPPGRQGIFLLPSREMTGELAGRLRAGLDGEVALYHGELAEGERRRTWWRCRDGLVRWVVGCRSALFLPLPDPGLVIVAREEDQGYRAEETPHHQARDLAAQLGERAGMTVVLASAAPSIDTMVRVGRGEYALARTAADDGRERAPLTLIDLHRDRPVPGSFLSGPLRGGIKGCLGSGRRVALFVNRRGFAATAYCADCFFHPRCPGCNLPLMQAGEDGRLDCRICGHTEAIFAECPRCGGPSVRAGGPGTKGVARELRKLHPGARILLVDRESLRTDTLLDRAVDEWREGRFDILVGTQLILQRRWPGIALLGVVDADTALHRPDFRAAEQTFRTLRHLAGMVGAGGKVAVQTRHADAPALAAAAGGDERLFYADEESARREAGFPPFGRLVLVTARGRDEAAVEAAATALKATLEGALASVPGADEGGGVFGPTPGRGRVRGLPRRHLLVKGPDSPDFDRAVGDLLSAARSRRKDRVDILAEADPGDLP
jgi:primosomal protein N' (replication factor Y)